MIAQKFCIITGLFLYAECNIVTISRMGKTMHWLQAIWKVRLNTGCYCLVRLSDRNNLNFVSLWEAARSSYALRVTTGHILGSGGKDRKKNSDTGLPGLDCFAKLPGIRTTPSSLYPFPVRFNCNRSADLDGRVNANNIQLSCFNDSDLFRPHADMCDSKYTLYIPCTCIMKSTEVQTLGAHYAVKLWNARELGVYGKYKRCSSSTCAW